MADIRNIAVANGVMRIDTGRYATSLEQLQTAGYMSVALTVDCWGNAFVYTVGTDTYILTSLGSDGAAGRAPPRVWPDEPYDPDIILMDGQFIQAPSGQ